MKIRHKLTAGFTIAVLLVAAVGIVSLLQLCRIAQPLREHLPEAVAAAAQLKHQDSLSQLIRYYDEVLTQSARNFAFTQNPKWEQRYKKAEPELDGAIKEALRNGDEKDRELFSALDKANLALVEMEHKSIELVNAGRAREATAILDSREYWDQKDLYQKGLTDYAQRRGHQYDDALGASTESIQSASRLAQNLLRVGILLVLGVVTAAVLLSTASGLTIFHSITGPLERLRMATNLRNTTASIDSLNREIAERQRAEAELSAVNRVLAAEIMRGERAEAERRENEQKFRVLFEVSSDAIMTLAPPTWKFTSGNPATVKMFQARDEAQFVSKGLWDVSPEFQPDGARSDDKAKAMIAKAMQEGSHFFEWDHMRLDGEVFPATILLTRVTLGEKVFLQATVRDITEAKKAEEHIRRNSEIQAALNQLLSLSLEDLTMDEILQRAIGQITSTAWLAVESKGAIFLVDDQEETLVMAAQRGMAAPLLKLCARVPFGKCTCGRAVRSGETQFVDCVDERHENTFEGIRPHGHYCVPILSSGKVLGVINTYLKEGHLRNQEEEDFLRAAAAVLAGIIERKRAQEALREREEIYGAIVNQAADAIVLVDARGGRFVEFNRAAHESLGYSREEFAQLAVSDIDVGIGPENLHDHMAATLAQGPVVFETRQRHRNGDLCDTRVSVRSLSIRGGDYFAAIWSDITERKQAEQKQTELVEQLAGTNQELKDFAYVVSHDLKAPLRAIRTLADWLTADYQDQFDEQGKENLRLLGSRVDRTQSLIDGILQYSRVGRTEQGTAPVDLRRIVPEIIENLGVPAHIAIHIEPDLPTVEADVTRITQVFQNLLSNAIKYLDKPQGSITVGCVEEEGFWRFRVCDNGPGIEAKHFDRIFKLFQTLAPRDGSESTGVGLTITKKIVELYGGQIWVESEVGQGSTFFFTFPKKKAVEVRARQATGVTHEAPVLAEEIALVVGGPAEAV
jgi:PAS domain S-box-containing protein